MITISEITQIIITWTGFFALIFLLIRSIRGIQHRNWQAFITIHFGKDFIIALNIWIILLWIFYANFPGQFTYIIDFYSRESILFIAMESLLIGMICGAAIYFFTKNKYGSIFLSIPFSALYLFLVYRYPFHLFLMVIELSMQYLFINWIEKKKK
ncbi:hypothetical protein M3215_03690 [Bacillus cytotoxicus]|uniref:Uncharacterized protein n=1 Tax=Bacillus cytotoxicus TaxID=580165 RepID=A0ACC6A2U1_9BACI|nr:hypothetical protein [Bacillus cytotoxicus]